MLRFAADASYAYIAEDKSCAERRRCIVNGRTTDRSRDISRRLWRSDPGRIRTYYSNLSTFDARCSADGSRRGWGARGQPGRDFLRALCLAESEFCSEFGGLLPDLHRVIAHQRFRSATRGTFAHGGSSRDRYGGHGDGQLQPSDQAVFGYDFFRGYLSKPTLGYPDHGQ